MDLMDPFFMDHFPNLMDHLKNMDRFQNVVDHFLYCMDRFPFIHGSLLIVSILFMDNFLGIVLPISWRGSWNFGFIYCYFFLLSGLLESRALMINSLMVSFGIFSDTFTWSFPNFYFSILFADRTERLWEVLSSISLRLSLSILSEIFS